MCGIVGVYNYMAQPRDERPHVVRARDQMVHRGPDDAGEYQSTDCRVALGHRRLSIIDLSPAGRQPMSNEDGSVWITFNGEIYNHQSFRRGLEEKGHSFRSRADTEVIIHLYEELGLDVVRELDGMFAFGLWDAKARRLFLARDRLGKKPLYYTIFRGRLVFASEIKALLAYPGVEREIDMRGLNLFLTFSNVPAPDTLFAGIKKLPAAHILTCDVEGNVSTSRYWSPLEGDGQWDPDIDEETAVSEVRRRLEEAVAKRLMSDVPIGCFLSGGVDSSTNVALMSRLTTQPLRTFSVGFEGFGADENFHDLPYARQVARQFGCDHREISITAAECREYLSLLAHQQDEPIGDPACLPMHFVSKGAREDGVKVVLVGEGSDEVFGGYDDMRTILNTSLPRWHAVRRLPRYVRRGVHGMSRLLGAPAGRVDLLRRAVDDEPLYWGLDVVFWDTEKRDLLTEEAQRQMGPSAVERVRAYYAELFRCRPDADSLQQLSYVELSNRLPELLLMRVDKISMAHSLEARAPFLDYHLSAFALSLRQNLKIRNGDTKRVLKRAVGSILPSEIIYRKKQGFRVPLPEWLAGELAPWAEDLLRTSPLTKRGLFRPTYIEEMWSAHKARRADHSFDLWCLLNLTAWYETWIEARPAP